MVGVIFGFMCGACAIREPVSGRVGEARGRIIRIEREEGLIAIRPKPDAAAEWFRLARFTAVRGADITDKDALQTGQRVYVRYLANPRTDPPQVLSITVVRYQLQPEGRGPASFEIPGF